MSLGRDCLKHPQLPWLTSTLQRDAESTTKFCPGGSLGVSSASSPLQRRPGKEKHSLPPVTHLHKDPLTVSTRVTGAEGMDPPRRDLMADQSINLFQSGPLRNPEEMAFRSASSLQHHHRTEKFNSLTSPTCKQPLVPVSGMGDLPFLCQWLSKSIIVWTVGHLLGFKAGSKGREQERGSNLLLLLLLQLLLLPFEIVAKTSPPRLALRTRARTGLSLSRLR